LRATTTPSTGAFDDGVPEVEPGLGKIGLVLVDLGLEILEQRVGDLDLSLRRAERRAGGALLSRARVVLGHRGIVLHLRGILVGLGDKIARAKVVLASEVPLAVHDRHLRFERLRVGRGEGSAGVLEVRVSLLDHGLLVQYHGLRGVELGLGLADLRLEEIRIDPRDALTLGHG